MGATIKRKNYIQFFFSFLLLPYHQFFGNYKIYSRGIIVSVNAVIVINIIHEYFTVKTLKECFKLKTR